MIDLLLLEFVNQSLAHPLLDVIMVGLSTLGLALLPGVGLMLLLKPTQRRAGLAILVALLVSLAVTLVFQYLALRPRPEAIRQVIETPNFPSFPSGHAAAAFSFALITGLHFRRWLGPALLLAAAIAVSRVYLGVHYPSDILAGMVLGSASGAAVFGLFKPKLDWRWLLWPQVAVAMVVTQMAYMGLMPLNLLRWPLADKVLHFLLFGAIVFWLNLWLNGRTITRGWVILPVAILVPLSIALVEEGLQHFSPLRTADITDLASDLAGMLFFWGVSLRFLHTARHVTPPALPPTDWQRLG